MGLHKLEVAERTAEQQVQDLAALGHSQASIANWLKVNKYHIDEGRFSEAYKLGAAQAENDLLAKAHERALSDTYRGADSNLFFLLKVKYGYREQSSIEVTGNPITLILTPDEPNPNPDPAVS